MALGHDESSPLQQFRRRVHRALPPVLRRRETVVLAVGAVALFALLIRLVLLGGRPAHWDEARVAYWALRFEETGAFAYRHIIHGPFVQHAASWLFAVFGPSDFLARLPVAVVGGLFPLSALLFREHLREEETVIVALVLATNSVVLYYSRFMRSDVLVAAFMITAFGFLVRLYDTRNRRYLYGVALFLALGIASKENALLYLLTWFGAAALVIDTTLYRPRSGGSGLALIVSKLRGGVRAVPSGTGPTLTPSSVRRQAASRARSLPPAVRDPATDAVRTVSWVVRRLVVVGVYLWKRYLGHVVGAALLLGAVLLFFFAPRGAAAEIHPVSAGEIGSVMFWEGLTNPWKFPTLVWNTASYGVPEYGSWFATAGGGDSGLLDKYLRFGPQYWEVLLVYAAPVTLFSVLGFLRERYGVARSRNLVMYFAYAGFASALAYPLGLDIFGPWNVTHSIVPLSVPAAVGLGVIYRWGREELATRDYPNVALVALILCIVVGQVGVTAAGAVYLDDQSDENKLVQYGQPADDLGPTVAEVRSVVAANEGTDVVVYGSSFVESGNSSIYLPACMGTGAWFDALPVSWYLYASGAETACAQTPAELEAVMAEGDGPPVIIAKAEELDVLSDRFDGYDVTVHRIRTSGSETAFLVDRDRIE